LRCLTMWFRCGIDEWHLECLAGGEIDLKERKVITRDHDFIASVKKRGNKLELFVPPNYIKVFDSIEALNSYLKALGLEEIILPNF
ncbi:MAG: hypothetical protein N3F06_02245, partial [Nitrososphaerales archaeon]|nr:hypothetical protein [Nitrososphaerales archaeon]